MRWFLLIGLSLSGSRERKELFKKLILKWKFTITPLELLDLSASKPASSETLFLKLSESLFFLFLINERLAPSEVSHDLLMRRDFLLKPRALPNLFNSGSLRRVKGPEWRNQLLELRRKSYIFTKLSMHSPELFKFVVVNKEVELISKRSRGEGRYPSKHNKENLRCSEEVNSRALVLLFHYDFRSHVIERSAVGLHLPSAVWTGEEAGHAEVCYLEVVLVIQQQVVWLQVAVRQAHFVQVVDCVQKLVEIVPADALWEVLCYRYEIE